MWNIGQIQTIKIYIAPLPDLSSEAFRPRPSGKSTNSSWNRNPLQKTKLGHIPAQTTGRSSVIHWCLYFTPMYHHTFDHTI